MYGILINNLGTPNSCSTKDVRAFLKEFLWDPRVVDAPRIIWWLVLNLIILNTRPKKSAEAYKKIWTNKGSPLLIYSENITEKIRRTFTDNKNICGVELGMRYSDPNIADALEKLKQAGAEKIIVLALYPQFSYTTTASVEDEVKRVIATWKKPLQYKIINDYHDHPVYIECLKNQLQNFWQTQPQPEKLLLSFHGIPQDYNDKGDPYQQQCYTTARLLSEKLGLSQEQCMVSFQSRLGPKKWLTPYTDETLATLGKQGCQTLQIICPGFSVDCLETLEEIALENKETFIDSGGGEYHYIPCLNDSEQHVEMLAKIIQQEL